MKITLYITSLLFMFSVVVGCQDSPDKLDDETSDEVIRANKAVALLSFFNKTELGENGKIIYTPVWGTVLYSNNPTVRYVVAEDLEDARQWFSCLVQAAEPNIAQDVTEYKVEGHGSIRFTPSTTTDRIATIHVDFAALPELREFAFILKDRWPDNDRTPFDYGTVQKHKKTGYRYVCIADSRSGTGTLITFDKKDWKISKVKVNQFNDYYPVAYYVSGMAPIRELLQLQRFMYNRVGGDKKYIRNDVAVEIFEKDLALCPRIYSNLGFLTSYDTMVDHWYLTVNGSYVFSDPRTYLCKEVGWFTQNPDLSVYILSYTLGFDSSSSKEFIDSFEEIYHP